MGIDGGVVMDEIFMNLLKEKVADGEITIEELPEELQEQIDV